MSVRVTLRSVLQIAVFLFPLSEIALSIFKRARSGTAEVQDRGSLRLLWLVIAASVSAAIAFQWIRGFRLPLSSRHLHLLSLVLLLAGLGIRWASILALGRFFTVDVAVHSDHRLVDTGLYRYVRHPSYAGLLLAFLGLGVYFGSWLSLVALVVPITFAVANRIAKEERVLLAALGPPYAAYCARTRRLIPGLL